jgi:glutamyl-tRNA reductase
MTSRDLRRFFTYGTNHKHAPLCLRESLYLSPEELAYALPKVKEFYKLPELAVLSTCNRLEMYGVQAGDDAVSPLLLFRAFYDLQNFSKKNKTKSMYELASRTFCYRGKEAVQHMFYVAASIDSLIVGETQITGQFKKAFLLAQEVCTLGPHLHYLSQKALGVAKKVRSETVIGQKTVSIGHAAIDLSRKIFTNLSEKKLLLLGAGDMAQVTGLYAKKVGIKEISIVNRSLERAQNLSETLGEARVGTLNDLEHFIGQADIVIAAMTSEVPLVTPEILKKALSKRRNRPMYIVDIAIPRNVHPSCGDFENVYLFELDDLQHYIDENVMERTSAARQAESIIASSLDTFCHRLTRYPESLLIAKFNEHVDGLIAQESQKSLARKELQNLSVEQRESLQRMLSSIGQKLTAHFAIAVKNMDTESRDHFKDLVQEITKTRFIQDIKK